MDIMEYGKILDKKGDKIIIQKEKRLFYYIDNHDNKVAFIQLKRDKEILLEFKDYLNDNHNLGTFTRFIRDNEYKFIDGKLIVKKLNRKTKFIKGIKPNKNLSNKYITLDIETRIINGTGLRPPYLISYFDGTQSFNFYLSDYLNGGFAPTCLKLVFYLYFKINIKII